MKKEEYLNLVSNKNEETEALLNDIENRMNVEFAYEIENLIMKLDDCIAEINTEDLEIEAPDELVDINDPLYTDYDWEEMNIAQSDLYKNVSYLMKNKQALEQCVDYLERIHNLLS